MPGEPQAVDVTERQRQVLEALVRAEAEDIEDIEDIEDKDYEKLIRGALADEKRSGAPPKFSTEQVAEIIALACEPPGEACPSWARR